MSTQSSSISDAAPGRIAPVEQRGGAGLNSASGRRRSPIASVQDSIMGAFRCSPLKAAEAELVAITTRRDGLAARLTDAEARAAEASAEQVRLLVQTDGNDAAAMKRASEACRRTSDEVAALKDGVRVAGELVLEAQAKVTAELDRIERERVATERTAQADRLEAKVAKVDAASRALAAARREMRAEAFVAIDPDPLGGPGAFAAQIEALIQHTVFPDLYNPPIEHLDIAANRYRVTTPVEAATPMLKALRTRIEGVRAGSQPATLPIPYPAPPVQVTIPEEAVFFVEPVGFHGIDNTWIEIEAGGHVVPAPVAARAVEMKVGFREGSREAGIIARLLSTQPGNGIERDYTTGEIRRIPIKRGDETEAQPARERVNLGISLHEWIAAERARLVGSTVAA